MPCTSVVSVTTQMRVPDSSSALATPCDLRTMKPCPSNTSTPGKRMPSSVSRLEVMATLRESTSISPDCSAEKRSAGDTGRNFTASLPPSTAAARALQKSTLMPVHAPSPVSVE